MQLLKPAKFPHVHPYTYTKFGFDHRLRKRLRREGFSIREIERLRQLYFKTASHRIRTTAASSATSASTICTSFHAKR